MKRIELLAPAGSEEAFVAAVQNGADAIYIGGNQFGARAYAKNFDRETMISLFDYAHLRGVKVYVTVNTIVLEDEFEQVKEYLTFLYENQCDGVIVQDLGVISFLRNTYPDFKIIGSTQMNIHNLQGAMFLKSLGIDRVVMARETSIDDIKKIKKEVDIELEVFAHGALCVAYSGQCLMSSFIGKRSGNRGRCAQSCRLNYKLVKDGNIITEEMPLLSTKDLMTLENLPEIIEAGASSLKIEGRMKSSEYVAQVVRVYREAIDRYYARKWKNNLKEEIYNLKRIFNREFTKGYLLNEIDYNVINTYRNNHQGVVVGKVIQVKNNKVFIALSDELNQFDGIRILSREDVGFIVNKMMVKGLLVASAKKGQTVVVETKSKVRVNDIVLKTQDVKLIEDLKRTFDKEYRKVRLNAFIEAKIGKPLRLVYEDENKNKAEVISSYVVEEALNSFVTEERIKEQISKLGNTCYILNRCKVIADEKAMIPMKFLNELRVKCIEKIGTFRKNIYQRKAKEEVFVELEKQRNIKNNLTVLIHKEEQVFPLLGNEISTIYVKNYSLYKRLKDTYKNENFIFAQNRIEISRKEMNDDFLACENGALCFAKDANVYGDVYLNIANSRAVAFLLSIGLKRVGLSLELDKKNIKLLVDNFAKNYYFLPPLEMMLYGRNDLMITKYCPISKVNNNTKKHCMECKLHNYELQDRLNVKFPILGDNNCTVHILNSRRLHLIEHISELKNIIKSFRLDFTIENKDDVEIIINAYKKALEDDESLELDNVTYGHINEKVL